MQLLTRGAVNPQAGQSGQPAAKQGQPPPEVAATQQAVDGQERQQAQPHMQPPQAAQQQPGQPPQQTQQQAQPPLAGDNAMNVVLVGTECAPWSKTGEGFQGMPSAVTS